MLRIFKILAIIILVPITALIVFFCYVFFVNPNILDFSSDDFNTVKETCDRINIGSDVESVINNTSESGLSPLLTENFLEIKKGICSCRLEYKDNQITKKYITACDVE